MNKYEVGLNKVVWERHYVIVDAPDEETARELAEELVNDDKSKADSSFTDEVYSDEVVILE